MQSLEGARPAHHGAARRRPSANGRPRAAPTLRPRLATARWRTSAGRPASASCRSIRTDLGRARDLDASPRCDPPRPRSRPRARPWAGSRSPRRARPLPSHAGNAIADDAEHGRDGDQRGGAGDRHQPPHLGAGTARLRDRARRPRVGLMARKVETVTVAAAESRRAARPRARRRIATCRARASRR